MDAINLAGVWLPFPDQGLPGPPTPVGHVIVGGKKPNLVAQYLLAQLQAQRVDNSIGEGFKQQAQVDFTKAMAKRYENIKITNAIYTTLFSEL